MTRAVEAELRARHAEYFVQSCAIDRTRFRGTRQRETFDKYEREQDNFQSSLDWLHAHGSAESELRLCAALTSLYQVRGFVVEGRENIERALQRIAEVSPSIRGQGYLALSRIAGSQDRYRESLKLLDSSHESFLLSGDRRASLRWSTSVDGAATGSTCRTSRLSTIVASFEGATERDEHLSALAEMGMGASKCQSGEFEEAQRLPERCRRSFSSMGDDRSLVRTIFGILDDQLSEGGFRRCPPSLQGAL